MVKSQNLQTYKEWLKELGMFSLNKRRLREGMIVVFQYLKMSCGRRCEFIPLST